jgi:lauroyl/myristoyl acyltransferase
MRKLTRWKRGQNRFVYYCTRALAVVVILLPERLAGAWGATIGWLLYVVLYGRRKIGRKNLALAMPDLDESKRRRILRGCYMNLRRAIVDVFRLDDDQVRLRVRYVTDGSFTLDDYKKALDDGNGIVVVTGHVSN